MGLVQVMDRRGAHTGNRADGKIRPTPPSPGANPAGRRMAPAGAILSLLALLWMMSAPAAAQEPVPPQLDAAAMAARLAEAQELAGKQVSAAQGKLRELLADLRYWHDTGPMTAESAAIFQDALVLNIGLQTKLLAPEGQILDSFRELLIINPILDENLFNPREKLLLEKCRSGQSGRLSLQTTPAEAGLYYLGRELARTPAELSLMAGSYRLTLTSDGYLDQELQVDIRAGETTFVERSLRRKAVTIVLSTSTVGTLVLLNHEPVGQTRPYEAFLSSLPASQMADIQEIIRSWRSDGRSLGFFRLDEMPVGEPFSIELRADCYEPRIIQAAVSEDQVDWSRPTVVISDLKGVQLVRDTGLMEVSSSPEGAEVWLDGMLQGRTPLHADVCSGTHRVQVLHSSGQFTQEVIIRKGLVSKVSGALKPALAFLGIYRQSSRGAPLQPQQAEWESAARQLALQSSTFTYVQIRPNDVEAARQSGRLPLDALLESAPGSSETDTLLRKIGIEAGKVNLVLVGLRTGDSYQFRLYNIIRATPDLIELPGADGQQLGFLIGQLNKTANVPARLRVPHIGIELLDTTGGLVVGRLHESVGSPSASLPAGSVIKSIDRAPMTYRELQAHLQTIPTGQTIVLEVQAAGTGAAGFLSIPVQAAGAEYPWNTPDSFPNAILTFLYHIAERAPASEDSKFARLSLALGLMRQGEWQPAADILEKLDLAPLKAGICQGTVLYYLARCHERLGRNSSAENLYTRALEYTDATLGTPDGPSVAALAEKRRRDLKKLR